MLVRSPPSNYHKYLDDGNNPIESGSKSNDNSDKEKTDNNTSRTNKEQPNNTTRFIQPNHGAVFGLFPKDGYILPGRSLAAERRGDGLEKPNKPEKKENNDKPKSSEVNKKPETERAPQPSFQDYTSVKHGINAAKEKLNLVNNKVEALDSGWRHIPHRVGEVETDMAAKGRMVDELEWRNKVHSAKIHELERELKQVQLENRNIKGQLLSSEVPGYDSRYDAIPEQDERYYGNQLSPRRGDPVYNSDRKYNLFEDQAKERYVRGRDGQPSMLAKNDQYNAQHVGKITDEQGRSYYGLNKIYDQDSLTSYRHEHVPYLMNKAEREKANPSAGGLFLLRFHDASLSDVNTALHLLQRQLSHSGAHVGLASSENVMLILGSSNNWRLDKKKPRKQIRIDYDCVQNAILSIWFPAKSNAEELFRSEHNNRFRDEIFLYPHSFESAFLPLREVPRDSFDSFLVIEVQGKHHPDDLQDFETNSRAVILQLCPRSQPFFASVGFNQLQMSIESIKGGALFRQGSRVFISAFEQLTDIADVWATGALYDMMTKNRINPGHVQVYAYSTKDTKYHFSSPHWR